MCDEQRQNEWPVVQPCLFSIFILFIYLPVILNHQHEPFHSQSMQKLKEWSIKASQVIMFVSLFLIIIFMIPVSCLMWLECELYSRKYPFILQITMCFVLGSEQCITRLFSRLIDQQVIWEFLGANLRKHFKRYILNSHAISYPTPAKKCRLGPEFIKSIFKTTNRNSVGCYRESKMFSSYANVAEGWLSSWSPREFL